MGHVLKDFIIIVLAAAVMASTVVSILVVHFYGRFYYRIIDTFLISTYSKQSIMCQSRSKSHLTPSIIKFLFVIFYIFGVLHIINHFSILHYIYENSLTH